jgi:hypothetical protein
MAGRISTVPAATIWRELESRIYRRGHRDQNVKTPTSAFSEPSVVQTAFPIDG